MTDIRRSQDPLARQVEGLSTLVQLEQDARDADDILALSFIVANETHRLTPYRQAFLWRHHGRGHVKLTTISGTARFDSATPMVRWLEDLGTRLATMTANGNLDIITSGNLPPDYAEGWAEWLPVYMVIVPIPTPTDQRLATLALVRDTPWRDGEIVLLSRLATAYGHAWHALEPRGAPIAARVQDLLFTKRVGMAAALLVTGAMFIPVPQSSLAPAEVVAAEPAVISAPMDGVVNAFMVTPNQQVQAGAPLFDVDDTRLRNRRDVAERSLDVARAQLERVVKRAFADAESRGNVAVLRAQVAEREAELAFTQEQLSQVVVRSDRAGIAVFQDANDWIGRPVGIGERVMMIADPGKVRLRMALPVDDLLMFPPKARVQLFLNISPLAPREAVLVSASYEAEPTEGGILAYEMTANFSDDAPPPRIGLKGTAKIYGETVSLFWYVMRKPISAARRALGV